MISRDGLEGGFFFGKKSSWMIGKLVGVDGSLGRKGVLKRCPPLLRKSLTLFEKSPGSGVISSAA
jgi:hypothetical protein